MITMRQGTVTSVSPLLVDIGRTGVGTPITAPVWYSPAIGDQVKVLVDGGERVIVWAKRA